MLSFRRSFSVLAVVAALACAAPLFAQEATVKGIMGSVKVLTARSKADPADVGSWPDARLNMGLREGDRIATLAESEARLETADGSTVRLRENTTLEVAALKGGANAVNAKLKVADGSIVTNVKKMAGGKSSFELETPTALAAIQGTTVELDSRKSSGTTIKTFDGKVAVAPAGSKGKGKKGKNNSSTEIGHYKMTEVGHGQQSAKSRDIPSYYKQKTTKLLSEEETSALTGFTRVILTYSELEEIKQRLEGDGIPCGIGLAESSDEMTARKEASDAARTELAKAMSTQVQRISESYAQNIGGEAKKIWEEGVRQITNVSVRGSSVHTTITQYNQESKRFKIYALMVLEPNRIKNHLANAANKMEEELELRVKKDDMMAKMDASIKAYETRYHDR